MEKFTWNKPDGEWGLYTYNIKDVPKELYGALFKLRDYEKIGTVREFGMAMAREKPEKLHKNSGVNICAECGRNILRCYSYCPDCGQAILWEGNKNETTS